jgi:hypothetical protein
MAQLDVEGDLLVVRLGIIDAMLSMRSTMRFPLTSVKNVYVDPVAGEEPKGFKAPGTAIPGTLTKGTFHFDGVKTFWNIWRGTLVVVVELSNEKFDRLVIEQANPEAIVQKISEALEALS